MNRRQVLGGLGAMPFMAVPALPIAATAVSVFLRYDVPPGWTATLQGSHDRRNWVDLPGPVVTPNHRFLRAVVR